MAVQGEEEAELDGQTEAKLAATDPRPARFIAQVAAPGSDFVPEPAPLLAIVREPRAGSGESADARLPPTGTPSASAAGGQLASGGGFEGRASDRRGDLVRDGGGSAESEAAVARGLNWLAAHQRADGSCNGYCRHPGTFPSTTGSTGLALMAFLGAGHTHQAGEHRAVVSKGLYYLCGRMVMTPEGGDLQEGSMYAQGIASIALCEAYAMTKDPSLRSYAQSAIDFIASAQDIKGGGWRYTPGQPGDTTMLGWQLMALKSGQLAGLVVPSPTIALVEKFLDSVETDYGAGYGYLAPEKGPTTTAIGLLCRMYTGWPAGRQHAPRGRGGN
jgi:hypothetical protein